MGHSSKKKKKQHRGGRRNQSKDHSSTAADNSEIVAEEFTALSAIFQEDCNIVSESTPQINIKLRPYSKDTGYEDSDISVILSVRCLQGYPNKCPKLQILPEKGLSKPDGDKLLSLLYDQANSNAREGRVMIYNLVEAAQEFLSEIVPQGLLHESATCSEIDKISHLFQKDATVLSSKSFALRGPFVYSHVDLFSGSGESWHWNLGMEESSKILPSCGYESLKPGNASLDNKAVQHVKPSLVETDEQEGLHINSLRLGTLEEESEDETKSIDSSANESVGNGTVGNVKGIFAKGNETDDDDTGSESSNSLSLKSVAYNETTPSVKRDLLLVHLLRLACAAKGPLSDALPEITSELLNLGIVSEGVRDLAVKTSCFEETFDRAFRHHIGSSKISNFWKTDFGESSSVPSSRYLGDFEELQPLGHGGFGHVVLCKNKLDGRQYAVKKIRLKDKTLPENDRILREVATLSRLQHLNVVRYYQAWYESGLVETADNNVWDSRTGMSSSFSCKDSCTTDHLGNENSLESTYLYIQMEYCPRFRFHSSYIK